MPPSCPKPTRNKKKKVKKPKKEKWICPNCPRGSDRKFSQVTLADKRAILDHIWGDVIFIRDKGTCQKSGKKTGLSPHHIFGKKAYPAGRYMVKNGILLGYAEHIHWAHGKPYDFQDWLLEKKSFAYWESLKFEVSMTTQFRAVDFDTIKGELENASNILKKEKIK